MKPEEVTLVVPCYNVAGTLPQVLTSIDNLDPRPARVVCIDDGSTDGTKPLIRRHDDVELVEHSQNRGLGATLNTGLLRTTTPGLAKVDADIVVDRDWLGKLCDICRTRDVDLIQGRFEEETTTTADEWREAHLLPNFLDVPIYNRPVNGSNILGRTDALRAVGGWDERYTRTFDDIDLVQRLVTAGYRVYYTPDVVTTHLRTDTRQDVLRAAWAYHYGSFGQDRGRLPPRNLREILLRMPIMTAQSLVSIRKDARERHLGRLWLSLLRPLYHLRHDVESLRNNGGQRESCLSKERMNYGDITLDLTDDAITPWLKRLFCRGSYERQETELVTKHLDSETPVIELGGGIGYLACVIDRQLNDSLTQVVVEPNDRLLSLTEHHRDLNDARFELVNAAYSTRDEPVTLEVPDQFWNAHIRTDQFEDLDMLDDLSPDEQMCDDVSSDARIRDERTQGVQVRDERSRNGPVEEQPHPRLRGDGSGTTTLTVETVDLRTLIDRYELSNVSVVVDIEGSEFELIENELDVLESSCDLLVVEFHPHLTASTDAVERAQHRLERASFERIDQEGPVMAYRASDTAP